MFHEVEGPEEEKIINKGISVSESKSKNELCDNQAKSKSSDHAHAYRNIFREGTTSFGGLCSPSGSTPGRSTTRAAGGSGIRRAKSLDFERLALGIDVSLVQGAGKLNNVAGASGLRGLLLGDGFGTVKVLLNGDDGKGCRENREVRVGEKNGEVQIRRSRARPRECVHRRRDPPVIGTGRRDGQLSRHNTEQSGASEGKTAEHGQFFGVEGMCKDRGHNEF